MQVNREEERKAMVHLLAFALRCSANNPAAIGGAAGEAITLLEGIGIQPRERGLFFNTPEAERADVLAALAALRTKEPSRG